MIHRLVYSALQDGLRQFTANPGLYDQLFGQLLVLSASEVAAIKRRFAARMPKIEHAFNPDPAEMPCYSVVMGAEQQASTILGNQAGYFSSPSTLNQPVFSTIWRHTQTIMCYAQQPDFLEYMYELAKAALYFRMQFFMENNCMEITISGSEVGVEDKAPSNIFSRGLTFQCAREFRFATADPRTQPLGIDGVYVDDGDPEGKVGIKALVTVKRPTVIPPSG